MVVAMPIRLTLLLTKYTLQPVVEMDSRNPINTWPYQLHISDCELMLVDQNDHGPHAAAS
jgi:hypothetical protein